jgi:hypothetical protein
VLKLLFLTSLTCAIIFSQPVLAQPTVNPPDGADETIPDDSVVLDNPLSTDSLPVLIGQVIRGILGIVGSLALAVFVYGGLVWMTAAGNAERVNKGKNTLSWAAIGLAVIFLSYPLIRYILSALTAEW